MYFQIRHHNRVDKLDGHQTYREFCVQTQRLTIGRANDQHVQIIDPLVEPNHAIIRQCRDNQLEIRALASSKIQINGELITIHRLKHGDSVQIGSAVITLNPPDFDHTVIVTIEEAGGANAVNLETQHKTTLRETCLSKHYLSWILAVIVMLLFFIIPVSGLFSASGNQLLRENNLLPDDTLWLTGPLHQSHQFIGKDCNSCHTAPFKMVQNRQCLECHADIQHHVDATSNDTMHFHTNRCASCHREHNEPSILIQRDQRFCVDCHRDLKELNSDTELSDVSDFGDDHPEFSLTLLKPAFDGQQMRWTATRIHPDLTTSFQEESSLQFSHKQHLDDQGIRSPKGDMILVCMDCHRPNSSGRQMLPIKMETHCSHCHVLDLDEDDTGRQIPHGDLKALFETLEEYFSRQYLEPFEYDISENPGEQRRRPGFENRMLSTEQRKAALNWAHKQSIQAAQDLIEDRSCISCHQILRIPGKSDFDQWYVKPVTLTKKWMPLAQFDHASHTSEECTGCHKDAEESENSSDILMPKIQTCRECHDGKNENGKLSSDCLMCHRFHLPNRGLFDETQRSNAEKSPVNVVISKAKHIAEQ